MVWKTFRVRAQLQGLLRTGATPKMTQALDGPQPLRRGQQVGLGGRRRRREERSEDPAAPRPPPLPSSSSPPRAQAPDRAPAGEGRAPSKGLITGPQGSGLGLALLSRHQPAPDPTVPLPAPKQGHEERAREARVGRSFRSVQKQKCFSERTSEMPRLASAGPLQGG